MRAWLRRNRWGLVGLPVAAVLLIAGNGYRLKDWSHQNEIYVRQSASGSQGHWVRFRTSFTDGNGHHTRDIRFKVASVAKVDSVNDGFTTTRITSPAYDVYTVTLDFRVDPSTVMSGCQVALTDDDGNRYDFSDDIDHVSQNDGPCTTVDQAGPEIAMGGHSDEPVAAPRPAAWTISPSIFVPKGATITGLRLFFAPPVYASVTVRPAR